MTFSATTVDCGPPPFLLNGAVSYQNTTEGSEGHYNCNNGFTLEGEMTTVCTANGSWDSIPFCRPETGMLYLIIGVSSPLLCGCYVVAMWLLCNRVHYISDKALQMYLVGMNYR